MGLSTADLIAQAEAQFRQGPSTADLIAQAEAMRYKAAGIDTTPVDSSEGMSGGAKLGTGFVRGMLDAKDAVKQIAAHVPFPLGGFSQFMDAGKVDKEVTDAAAEYEKGGIAKPGDWTSPNIANVGRLGGSVVATAPLGGVGGGAVKVLPMLARNALMGAGMSVASTPVTNGGDFAAEKGKQAALGGLFGAGASALARGGGRLLEEFRSMNQGPRAIQQIADFNLSPAQAAHAAEGQALATRTGVPMSPGAISGSKTQVMAENVARQSLFSRELAFEADKAANTKLVQYIDGTLDKISAGGATGEQVGNRVQGTIRNAITDIAKRRDVAAKADYGAVNDLIKRNRTPILPTATVDKLSEIMENARSIPGTDPERIFAWASKQTAGLEDLKELPKLIQVRSFWSNAAKSDDGIFGRVTAGTTKRIATQMVAAVDDDLARAAIKLGGPIGDLLKTANKNYAQHMGAIEAIERSPVAKFLGDDIADDIANTAFNTVPSDRVMTRLAALSPSELKLAGGYIGKWQPAVWQAVKRRYIEDAFDASKLASVSEGANALPMRGNVFVNSIGKTPDQLQKLHALLSPGEMAQISDAFQVIRRMGDKTGYNFSGTASATEASSVLRNPLSSAAVMGAGQIIGQRQIARMMGDPASRAALLELKRLPPGSARARQIFAQLAAVGSGDSMDSGAQNNQGQQP